MFRRNGQLLEQRLPLAQVDHQPACLLVLDRPLDRNALVPCLDRHAAGGIVLREVDLNLPGKSTRGKPEQDWRESRGKGEKLVS